MAPLLEAQAELAAAGRQAMAWLTRPPEPGLVVDVGSGPGIVSCLFADAFPDARVVAAGGRTALDGPATVPTGSVSATASAPSPVTCPGVLGELDYPAD
ncbi:hypothetical protein LV779_39040 [Streptomyces thinghirensis]|nr:hypothetical protein [Streptomyces thinghirensis]